jgi:hypothetical protein
LGKVLPVGSEARLPARLRGNAGVNLATLEQIDVTVPQPRHTEHSLSDDERCHGPAERRGKRAVVAKARPICPVPPC